MRRWTESRFALSWVANSILAVHGHDAKHWPFRCFFYYPAGVKATPALFRWTGTTSDVWAETSAIFAADERKCCSRNLLIIWNNDTL